MAPKPPDARHAPAEPWRSSIIREGLVVAPPGFDHLSLKIYGGVMLS